MITVGYTIFNKAHLIPQVVEGIKNCFSPEDEIIFLLDACTDNSFSVIQEQITEHLWDWNIKVIDSQEELFETKANNEILKQAYNDVIVLFQDDMICKDPQIKNKITNVINSYGDELGLIGGRSGFELVDTSFPEKIVNKVSSWEHLDTQYEYKLKEGEYLERTFLNRGPLVFTKKLLESVGYFDEAYYPQWCDDADYCARSKFAKGKKNVVFQCNIESQVKWGATRSNSTLRKKYRTIMSRNWDLFISRWGEYIR